MCNDGSADSTEQVIEQKAAQHKDCLIICLSHLINRGPGAANKTLFAFATQNGHALGVDWFVTYDADGQMDIADMNTFMRYADPAVYDLII